MTVAEFIDATTRIEEYYDEEYTTKQRQIMYEELKFLEIERYKKIVSTVLRNSKYLPKIADFIKANKIEPINSKTEEKEKIPCSKCNGTGYVIYYKKIHNGNKLIDYPFAAVCTCGNAKTYKGWNLSPKQPKSDFYIPTITELGIDIGR